MTPCMLLGWFITCATPQPSCDLCLSWDMTCILLLYEAMTSLCWMQPHVYLANMNLYFNLSNFYPARCIGYFVNFIVNQSGNDLLSRKKNILIYIHGSWEVGCVASFILYPWFNWNILPFHLVSDWIRLIVIMSYKHDDVFSFGPWISRAATLNCDSFLAGLWLCTLLYVWVWVVNLIIMNKELRYSLIRVNVGIFVLIRCL